MSRKFIRTVIIAAVAVATVSAGSARAGDSDDVLRLLGSAAVLALIGKAIADSGNGSSDSSTTITVTRPNQNLHPRPDRDQGRAYNTHPNRAHDRTHDRAHNQWPTDRDAPRYSHRDPNRPRSLPARCVQRLETQRSTRYVLTDRCLSKHYRSARPLPKGCRVNINRDGRLTQGYGLRCLRRNGYETAMR